MKNQTLFQTKIIFPLIVCAYNNSLTELLNYYGELIHKFIWQYQQLLLHCQLVDQHHPLSML